MCNVCANILLERAEKKKGPKAVFADMLREHNRVLADAWIRESDNASDQAIEQFLKKSGTDEDPKLEAGYKAFLAALTKNLAKVTNQAEKKKIQTLVDGLYKVVKQAEVKKLKTDLVSTQLDKGITRTLGGEGPFWIGDFYKTHMSERISEVGRAVLVDGGFGREAAGRTMRDILTEEFRLRGGPSTYESTIPARFAGNVDNYSRIVSANVGQRARVYSAVSGFRDAGITVYEFVAVMDDRTSEVCQEMNGRRFATGQAVAIMEAAIAADSPEAFIESHPWPKNADQVRSIAGTGSAAQQSANLANNNIAIPPLHGFCRSAIVAVS
jgi:hypothetical protein